MPPTQSEVARDKRADIEATHNVVRETIEKNYVTAKENLENTYHADIQNNAQAKRAAFIAAGLNSDGSDPQGRPQG